MGLLFCNSQSRAVLLQENGPETDELFLRPQFFSLS